MPTIIKRSENGPLHYAQTPLSEKAFFHIPDHIIKERAKDPSDDNVAIINRKTGQAFFFVEGDNYYIHSYGAKSIPFCKGKVPKLVTMNKISWVERIKIAMKRAKHWNNHIRRNNPLYVLTNAKTGYTFPIYDGDAVIDKETCRIVAASRYGIIKREDKIKASAPLNRLDL